MTKLLLKLHQSIRMFQVDNKRQHGAPCFQGVVATPLSGSPLSKQPCLLMEHSYCPNQQSAGMGRCILSADMGKCSYLSDVEHVSVSGEGHGCQERELLS